MNSDFSNRSGRGDSREFHTHRSDRYRFPERDSSYHFDDYGSSARGGYGNEGYSDTWGNQGNEMGGSRNVANRGFSTYDTGRNFGNMGSYGGAQGFGDYRGGQHPQGSNYNYYSGMGSRGESDMGRERHRSHGYESDYDSHGSGYNNEMGSSLYGSDTSRRFQGSDQGRYDFDRDNYNQGSGSFRGSDRDRGSSGYGSSGGGYMGSGYSRSSRSDYGTGNYGSMGSYDRGSSSMSYGEPYSMRDTSSRYTEYPNDTYPRDTENTRIQHRDSDYDYDPDHSFDVRRDPEYIRSHNRSRTWDRGHEGNRDYDRY